VHGLVLNSRNEPELGVAVNITGHLGQAALFLEAPRAIETDSDGQFSFESLESGEYTITAEKDHTFIAEEISLTAGETRNLTLNLKRMIKVSGNVEIKDPSIVGQPILMKNMDNDRIYMAPMNTEGHFELFVPPGEYIVNIGEIEVSARVSIADDSEDYFLDLTY
ncbi:MAG TPA: carboxypeptidase-like regulatory domain-containing protein, partial [Candidatus Sumerlaeota bacterium]|nr:carboxypeptidase-like regulatory domain-containing protein [Candidatus Sumerlaeota bacterium]